MNIPHAVVLQLVLWSLFTMPVFAQTRPDNQVSPKAGDRISFPVNVRGRTLNTPPTALCIPAKTALRVNSYTKGKDDKTADQYVVSLATVFAPPEDCDTTESPAKLLPKGEPISLLKVNLPPENRGFPRPSIYGLTYGGLVVPFKYHLRGSKEFKGGSSVAPYVGYRFDENDLGLGVKAIAFAGISSVDVAQNVDGQAKSQSLAGYSYGVGLLGSIQNSFQMGLILGADRVSKSANYADNGRWWLALSIGYAFSE
jgi:hypothetical protein